MLQLYKKDKGIGFQCAQEAAEDFYDGVTFEQELQGATGATGS